MILKVFVVGAIASFVGSIPPGTLNILVLQLGLQNRLKAALQFALAVAVVEYPYAWIAVAFEGWITSSPVVKENLNLLAATVMIVLGLIGLWGARKPTSTTVKFEDKGFARGIILGLLNPQAIPWWIGMTAYLKAQGWIAIDTTLRLHAYIFGTSVGVMILLTLLAFAAQKVSRFVQHNKLMAVLPSAALLLLGLFLLARIYL